MTNQAGYAYIAPAIGLMFAILYFPSLYGFYYSLFDVQFLLPTEFIGLYNYVALLDDPEIVATIVRSAFFTACAVVCTLSLALLIASWINSLTGWLALFVQICVIIPWVISHVVQALLFRWVFVNEVGLGVYLLESLGIPAFSPLSSASAAMALLIAFATWRALGFAVIILLAGLKSIPGDYYEAAWIDGATPWQAFRFITLPQLKTPMLITIVILTLSNLNNVETPLIVTGGGPAGATNILPLDLYMRAFASFDFNSAIAMAIGMFVANVVLVLFYVRLAKWRV
jgi:multiple sugar transport system permease protein